MLTFIRVAACVATLLLLSGSAVGQTTWYVDDDAPGDPCPGDPSCSDPNEDGTAAHPFDAIQEGIDAANNGDRVEVAGGFYGGFFISDFTDLLIECPTGPSNCRILGDPAIELFNVSDGVAIDGFTFEGDGFTGYGVYCNWNASPTLSRCTVTGFRDGVACDDASNASLIFCTMSGNDQSGIYAENSDVLIHGCTIATNLGAGVDGLDADIIIIGSTITGNRGEGVHLRGNSPVFMVNSQVVGNSDGGIDSDTTVRIHNSLFAGNRASLGAVLLGTGSLITNSIIAGTSASNPIGGGLYVIGEPLVTNCIFQDNTPKQISGIYASPIISYSNVQGGWPGLGNIDADPKFIGGQSGTWTADATYDAPTNQITFYDVNADWSPGELLGSLVQPDVEPGSSMSPIVLVITDNTATTMSAWADGDTFAHGPWVSAGMEYQMYDFRLSAGSPCIDAGDNAADPASLDLDLNPRFVDDAGMVDVGNGTPPIVDMGAYEFQDQTCLGDVDGDGVVGLSDLATVISNYEEPGVWYFSDGDLDRDGDVDLSDLSALLAVYDTICD